MNTNAAKKLTISRSKLLLDNYFFGRLALYLQMVEEPEIPTLAVDGVHIYYNPQFILSLSEELVTSAIAHEIMHCVFEHIFRRGSRDPFLWNCAGDYAINLVLADSGFRLGPGWLLNVKYRDFRYVIPFLVQVLLCVTPVIYPVSMVKPVWAQQLMALNPMYASITVFRMPFSSAPPAYTLLMISMTSCLVLLAVGLGYFRRTEAFFADLA